MVIFQSKFDGLAALTKNKISLQWAAIIGRQKVVDVIKNHYISEEEAKWHM